MHVNFSVRQAVSETPTRKPILEGPSVSTVEQATYSKSNPIHETYISLHPDKTESDSVTLLFFNLLGMVEVVCPCFHIGSGQTQYYRF